MSLFTNLEQKDVPQLQSLYDKKIRQRNLKLMLCKTCLLSSNTFGVVPELLIEGINITKITKSKRCWFCSGKK